MVCQVLKLARLLKLGFQLAAFYFQNDSVYWKALL